MRTLQGVLILLVTFLSGCGVGKESGGKVAEVHSKAEREIFGKWIPVKPEGRRPEIYRVRLGTTFQPDRIGKIVIWVDTGGLYKWEPAAKTNAIWRPDFITVQDIHTNELFANISKLEIPFQPHETHLRGDPDDGEMFIFSSGDEFLKAREAVASGEIWISVQSSAEPPYVLPHADPYAYELPQVQVLIYGNDNRTSSSSAQKQ